MNYWKAHYTDASSKMQSSFLLESHLLRLVRGSVCFLRDATYGADLKKVSYLKSEVVVKVSLIFSVKVY